MAKQIDSDNPSADAMVSPECCDFQAVELTQQIIAQKVDEPLLIQFGFPPELIASFKFAIEKRTAATNGDE